MNIGIIVYSQTGNTESVARELEKELSNADYNVKLESITVEEEVKPGKKDYNFKKMPDPDQYDFLVFGSPIQAFSLCSVMSSYLGKVESLENKKVACFITKGLPFNWTGGSRSIRQFKKLCEDKGAEVVETGIIKWGSKKREEDTRSLIKKLSRAVV